MLLLKHLPSSLAKGGNENYESSGSNEVLGIEGGTWGEIETILCDY